MATPETGIAIIVVRQGESGIEVLLLHRSFFPSSYAGDWAWTTPGGRRDAHENPEAAAARELREETGLTVRPEPVTSNIADLPPEIDLHVFVAEVPSDAAVRLSDEHDRYEWVTPPELQRCLPAWVSAMYADVLARLSATSREHGK